VTIEFLSIPQALVGSENMPLPQAWRCSIIANLQSERRTASFAVKDNGFCFEKFIWFSQSKYLPDTVFFVLLLQISFLIIYELL
jgi:hypothetical protein